MKDTLSDRNQLTPGSTLAPILHLRSVTGVQKNTGFCSSKNSRANVTGSNSVFVFSFMDASGLKAIPTVSYGRRTAWDHTHSCVRGLLPIDRICQAAAEPCGAACCTHHGHLVSGTLEGPTQPTRRGRLFYTILSPIIRQEGIDEQANGYRTGLDSIIWQWKRTTCHSLPHCIYRYLIP